MSRYLWTQKEDIGPSGRFGHAMTYDSSRSRTILFGGARDANVAFSDTWEWNGEFWTQIADIGPSSRQDLALCFDSIRNTALLFGGLAPAQIPLGDTWSWNGEDWTQLEDSGPPARSGHAMVFDSARGRAVLFGGISPTGRFNDTWEWDGQAWTQQEDTGPSPRAFHAMGFDLVRKRVVLFGGDNGVGETWSWDGSNWTQISNFGARPSLRAAMVSTDVQIAMFGGLNATGDGTMFHDTWVFDGKHWTHRQDIGPGPRQAHAMAYDSARRTIVLFGGLPTTAIANPCSDTWEHIETDVAEAAPPPPTPGQTAEVQVISLALEPPSTFSGSGVLATINLSAPAPAGGTQVELGWVQQGLGVVTLLNEVNVSEGAASVVIPFSAPQAPSGAVLQIVAATLNSTGVSANLQVN